MAKRIFLFILILVFAGMGVARLRFQTDLTSVLPSSVAQVDAVKSFHQYFSDDHQMVIHVSTDDAKVYAEDIEELSAFIQKQVPNSEAMYESVFEKKPELFAGEVGKTWVLSEANVVTEFYTNLTNEAILRRDLRALKENIKNSFQSGEAIAHSYDPLGFMRHPGLAELAKAEYSFESDDGKSRFLFLKRESGKDWGYQEDAAWVKDVKKAVSDWNEGYDNLFSFGFTGGPVYNSEVGAGMEKDMLGTVSVTLGLIALLFLIMQRSAAQLLLLILLVSTTFFITLGIAGWVSPHMNVLSIAFAAILLGLIIDYAVVLLREARHFPPVRHEIRKGMRRSVIWAALTTALVFSVLTLSSFPGVKQLGILIVIGLATGALVMLWGVPWFVEKIGYKRGLVLTREARRGSKVLLCPILLLCTCGVIFWLKGSPAFEFSLESIQPKTSEAARVQKELSQQFTSWSDLRTVVFAEAETAKELQDKLQIAQEAASSLQREGLLTDAQIPAQMVPFEDCYTQNRKALQKLKEAWPQILSICQEEGFTTEGTKFDDAILNEILSLPPTLEEFKALPRENPITKGMMAEYQGHYFFRGNVVLKESLKPEHLEEMHLLNSNGVTMTGWGALSATLQPLVQSDFKRIFLPAALVILLGLGLVFRNVKETLLVLLILLTSLAAINSIMVLKGISWNFLNCIAFPLIVGIGIDYSIHLVFAMRRQGQDQRSIWRGVGLAISFCGLSSVIGFGSLTLANNDLLKSLGWICAIGVFITMFLSLFVIPPVWRKWCNPQN